ncbi:MAG: nucleoside deaminase [Ginsengibacter sp.]
MKENLTDNDLKHLKHCLILATESVKAGDKPFGSILVNENEDVIAEARNRVIELTALAHPEYELAKWAAENLSPEQRKQTKMYTTGEHCPMCAAAHGWVGLGEIIYLSSAKQLQEWLAEMNVPPAPIRFYPVEEIIPGIKVKGPAEGALLEEIKKLHQEYYDKMRSKNLLK